MNTIDQYLVSDSSYQRLKREYNQYNSLVVAYDFDNTLYDYHGEGGTYNQVIDLLQKLKSINCYLICWTAIEDTSFVKEFLNDNNIPFDSINENPPFFNNNTRKIYYNALLDDRAGLKQVFEELTELYNDKNFS